MARLGIPPLPAGDGAALVERATARMGALDTFRIEETLGPIDPPLLSRYELQAPDRLRFEVVGRSMMVRINESFYRRELPSGDWTKEQGPPLTVPFLIWDFPEQRAVRVVGEEVVEGVPTTVVSFFISIGGSPVWYRLWVDGDALVHRAEMRAEGHFMDHDYFDFGAPISIEAPVP